MPEQKGGKLHRCTIDIDFDSQPWKSLRLAFSDEELMEKIRMKLLSSPCGKVEFLLESDSPSLCGKHVAVFSRGDCTECYACRLAFDDQRRLEADLLHRPKPEQRDILFTEKRKAMLASVLEGLGLPSSARELGLAPGAGAAANAKGIEIAAPAGDWAGKEEICGMLRRFGYIPQLCIEEGGGIGQGLKGGDEPEFFLNGKGPIGKEELLKEISRIACQSSPEAQAGSQGSGRKCPYRGCGKLFKDETELKAHIRKSHRPAAASSPRAAGGRGRH